jgi:hypothetical protein
MREYYHRNLGGVVKVKILCGARQIWPAIDWATIAKGDLTGPAHDVRTNVAAGQVIRFALAKGTTADHDLVAWTPRIQYEEPLPATASSSIVRILCGADAPYVDSNGNAWQQDRFFSGGTATATSTTIEAAQPTEGDQTLYQHGRMGKDFSYSIPVQPGLYALRLKFAEPSNAWFFERPINVDLNGKRVMQNGDVCQAAKGCHRAYEKVLRYVVPDADGKLTLRFSSGEGPLKRQELAIVQAIEILPEARPAVRIHCGSETNFIDWNGTVWNADAAFDGGKTIRSDAAVSQASPTLFDQELYRTARTGRMVRYSVPVQPGLYAVHLKFAELWLKQPGGRPMSIKINGRLVRENWDPAAAAGQMNMASDIRVENIAPDNDGRISVTVAATGANDAILQGIEIE